MKNSHGPAHIHFFWAVLFLVYAVYFLLHLSQLHFRSWHPLSFSLLFLIRLLFSFPSDPHLWRGSRRGGTKHLSESIGADGKLTAHRLAGFIALFGDKSRDILSNSGAGRWQSLVFELFPHCLVYFVQNPSPSSVKLSASPEVCFEGRLCTASYISRAYYSMEAGPTLTHNI